MSQTEKDPRVRSLPGCIWKRHILFVHGCSLPFHKCTHTHTHTRKKKIQLNTDHKNKCIIYYTNWLVYTHTHTWNSNYMGIVVPIQKDPEFPLMNYIFGFCTTSEFINPLVPELFGRVRKNLIVDRGIEYYRFIFLTRCWLGKPHSNHISLNRPIVWDSPHFFIEKIE